MLFKKLQVARGKDFQQSCVMRENLSNSQMGLTINIARKIVTKNLEKGVDHSGIALIMEVAFYLTRS